MSYSAKKWLLLVKSGALLANTCGVPRQSTLLISRVRRLIYVIKTEPDMRLNLRLNGTAEELVSRLAEKFGIKPKDTVLDALAILNLAALEIEKNGGRLGIQTTDGEFMAIATPAMATLSQRYEASQLEKEEDEKKSSEEFATA